MLALAYVEGSDMRLQNGCCNNNSELESVLERKDSCSGHVGEQIEGLFASSVTKRFADGLL